MADGAHYPASEKARRIPTVRSIPAALTRAGGGIWAGMFRRRASGDIAFVDTVRSHSHAASSDAELRAAISRLGSRRAHGDRVLPEVFAAVDEATRRRLGAWRLMNAGAELGPMSRYREAADRILEHGSYSNMPAYYTEDGFVGSARFARSVDAEMDPMDLDSDERVIVKTLVDVGEKSRLEHWWDILLPAEFYRAVALKDTTGAVDFRPTDEQLLAGRLLFEGRVVEMSAGEGKTVAGAFAGVAYVLSGRSVHVVTANDYLAERDQGLLALVYESLGLSSGVVLGHMNDGERRAAYGRRIVYGTIREFGFDFLRDNLKYAEEERVQGPMDAAIVDEADHSLIDEARTPLIIAGGGRSRTRSLRKVRSAVELLVQRQRGAVARLEAEAREGGLSRTEKADRLARLMLADPRSGELTRAFSPDSRLYRRVRSLTETDEADLLRGLTEELEYTVDRDGSSFALTEGGERSLEAHLGPLFDTDELERRLAWTERRSGVALVERRRETDTLRRRIHRQYGRMNQVYQMLRAFILMRRDVDYVVSEDEVVLVDAQTGRRRPDSRYQDGLQAAIEAKEGVRVHADANVLAEISVQGLMALYRSVSGMTGTARRASTELRKAYGVEVAAVPPSVRSRRVDLPTRLYESRDDKLSAVVDEVRFWQSVGRPVLIGTLTVEQSEAISRLLTEDGIGHRLLNAVNSADEAQVVRSAGSFGAVTVATNMAGRGTDILLEPELNRRISHAYAELTERHLAVGAGRVEFHCKTGGEAAFLRSALVERPAIAVSGRRTGADGHIVVASRADGSRVLDMPFPSGGRSPEIPSPPGGRLGWGRSGPATARSLEFGLGLHVIGTEMNESRRVDDQLRGRTGRQGEFGSTRFFLSLEDEALASSAGMRRPVYAEGRHDSAGRLHYEGRGVVRRLEHVQALMEQEDETARALALDYTRVLEHMTLSYYGARRSVPDGAGLDAALVESVHETARRLVADYLPPQAMSEYPSRFDLLAEHVRLDYGVDCGPLFGLGVERLGEELGRRMALAFRAHLGAFDAGVRSDVLTKTVMQTADELWAGYLSQAHEAMLNAQLCAWGHTSAVADFMLRSAEAYRRFESEALSAFLPRFLRMRPSGEEDVRESGPQAVEELEKILA